jgi:calcium-dependent protein kinase
MGNCCQVSQVVEIQENKSVSKRNSLRSSSYILDKYSIQKDFRKKYEYQSLIGSGAFGKVRLYVDRDSRTFKYAIKTIKKNIFKRHSIESIKREVDILRSLDHPNIVKYFETYEDECYLHIVMEYIAGDNLFRVLTDQKGFKFTERTISKIITCLLKAVLFLHHNGIIHRDIKPENIVFVELNNFNALKLIDFGLSIQQNAKKDNRRVGTPYYMSPEMVRGNFNYASDVWSIGVILFIMVTGKQPFRGKSKEEVFEKIKKGAYDKNTLTRAKCSKEVKDLIKKMLVIEHTKRITVECALDHIWFKQFEKNKNINLVVDQEIIDSLKQFQYQNIFQKEIRFYLAKLCSDKEILKLKHAFLAIDKDNSGEIEYEEIPKIFNELNIEASDTELKNIFSSMDFHCDGKVNYSEFLAATISSINFNKEEKLWSAFKYFDTTDSGYITLDSVMDALKNSGVIIDEEGLTKTFNELQKKGKKINFREFKAIALGKDDEEHDTVSRRDSNYISVGNDVDKNFNKQISFKERESKDNIINNENNNLKTDKEINNNKEENKENNILNLNDKDNVIDKEKNNENNNENNIVENITNKEEDNIYNQNSIKKATPIINEIKENINMSNNAYNDIIINNSINKKNEKSKSKSNSKSNNKSNNKSNVDLLVEEHNNNDKYTDVQN